MTISLNGAPRELIIEFAKRMALEFELTDIAQGSKEIWERMREFDPAGKCFQCRQGPAEGHTFEECVARIHGRIDQLYRPKGPAK